MKMKFTREVKIGLMVLVAIFILYFGINFLKGIDIFQKESNYIGYFENIDGLVKSSPVKVKGFKVGQVSDILYDFSKRESFTVVISVSNDIKLPIGTIMKLSDDGLMGGKVIELVSEPLTNNVKLHKNKDELPTEVGTGIMASVAGSLMPKIEKVAMQADSLLLSVRKLTDSEHLNNSMKSLEATTADLAISSAQLRGIMSNQFPSLMNNMTAITGDFQLVSENLKKVDFAGTMENVDYTVKNLQIFTDKLNNNENSLGLLMNDKNLYINLNNTAENADKLLIDLKENPKRYVHFSLIGKK
ncbi:MAG: MlaD family protein [Paludibacteraceae bacterium]